MTLQEILKDATRKDHDELEELMHVHQIMDGSLSVDHYKEILATNFTVHKICEHRLYSSLSKTIADELELNSRYKLAALEADLKEMQIIRPHVDVLVNPEIGYDDDAAILGALYVLEGATLGGSMIVKKLKINPNLNRLNLNFNYYQVYGDKLKANWHTFVRVLNQQPEPAYRDCIAGATIMFNFIAAIQKFHIFNMR